MKPVAFGKVPVATAGTPVQLGAGILAGAIGTLDTQFTITSNGRFCADMVPFDVKIDNEEIEISAYNDSSGLVTAGARGVNGTVAASHSGGAGVFATTRFALMVVKPDDANTGRSYIGTSSLSVSTKRGIIKSFMVPAGGVSDDLPTIIDYGGDRLKLTDYWLDVGVSTDGLIVAIWII